MKVFLLGGFGFIGKRFIRKFSKEHEIIVYATKECVLDAKKAMDVSNITIEEGHVEDGFLADVIKKHKPDVVVHLAALTGLVKCHNSTEDAFRINVYGTFNAINACLNSSKMIFISSREVYGETIGESSKEDDPLLPNNVYGITKKIGEDLIKLAGERNNLDFTILRLTNVYGPEGNQYGAQKMIQKALNEKKIQIMGGSQKLNYVYVEDVIDIINKAISDTNTSNQIFNVGSFDTLTVEQFAQKIIEEIGEKIELEYIPMRETETSNFTPNLNKMKPVFGILPTPLKDGIKTTIDWYKNSS